MNLKQLARSYSAFDGAVTFYMLPYRPLIADVIISRLETVKPRDEWDSNDIFFTVAESRTVDIEFDDDLPVGAVGLQAYWQGRNGSVTANHEAFLHALHVDALVEWINAFTVTKENAAAASPDLETPDEGADPERSAATPKPSMKSRDGGGKSQKPAPKRKPKA